jgi:hypothetical protein
MQESSYLHKLQVHIQPFFLGGFRHLNSQSSNCFTMLQNIRLASVLAEKL